MTDEGANEIIEGCRQVGEVDILVNNYGTTSPGTWAASEAAAWHDAYDRNVLSGVRLVQRLLPTMLV